MTYDTQTGVLVKMTDVSLTVSDPIQDIRGRKVIDQHGDEIGHVSALFIDQGERRVRMLQVAAGGFLGLGERHFLIPVETVSEVTPKQVQVNQTCERVVNSPAYDPDLAKSANREFFEPYYRYYGYAPYRRDGGLGYPIL